MTPHRKPAPGGDFMQMFEGPDEASLDEHARAQIAQARETFRELEKLTKNIALYGRAHQSVVRFRGRFFEAMKALIGDADRVTFQIGPYDFTMYEQSVFQNPNPERNFVYRFYLDGVRHLSFDAAVTLDELDRFVDVLLTDWDDPALFEDDAVTLLWQAHFEHIGYVLIDNFDEDAREGEERLYTVAGVVDQVRSGPTDAASAAPPPMPGATGAARPSGGRASAGRRVDLSSAGLSDRDLEQFVESPFAMDEAEFRTLERAIRTHGRETLEKFIEILFKVSLAEGGEAGERIVGLFDRIADLLLDTGRFGELERLLRKVRRLTGPGETRLPENLRAIERIFVHWSTPRFVERVLTPLVADPTHPYTPSILAICGLLNDTAVVAIADAAGRVAAEGPRGVLYGLVARMLAGHEREIAELLRRVEAAHAHDLLRLLAAGDPKHLPYAARAALHNPDPRVRFEGLSALPIEDTPQTLELMFQALEDPARTVRSKAIHLIARVRRPEVHARVMAAIDKKSFAEFDLAEKRRYFAAAALTGDPQAAFVELFDSGGLLRGRGQDELRHCAAVALGVRLHREATPLFERELGRRLKSEVVTDAAGWAMQHMQHDRETRTRQLYDIFFKGELTRAEVADV